MTTQTKQILKMQGAIAHLPLLINGFFPAVVKKGYFLALSTDSSILEHSYVKFHLSSCIYQCWLIKQS